MATTVLTTTGDWITRKLLAKSITCSPSSIRCATCAGTAAVGDTGLFAVAAQKGVELTVVGSDLSSCMALSYQGTITMTAGHGITNAGSFITTSSDGPGIFVHGDIAEVDVLTNDQLQFTIEVTFS